MQLEEVVSARGGILWLGACQRSEPVANISENENLTLEVPGVLLAAAPQWLWAQPECQSWRARFAVHSEADYLVAGTD